MTPQRHSKPSTSYHALTCRTAVRAQARIAPFRMRSYIPDGTNGPDDGRGDFNFDGPLTSPSLEKVRAGERCDYDNEDAIPLFQLEPGVALVLTHTIPTHPTVLKSAPEPPQGPPWESRGPSIAPL